MNKLVISLILITSSLLVVSIDERSILEPLMNGPKKELFKAYHFVYKKEYDLYSEEGIERYRAFRDNLKFINEENKKGHTYTLGIGPWTDLTNQEYREKVLQSPEKMKEFMEEKRSVENSSSQTSYVNYSPGTVSINHLAAFGGRTKDQGSCGSCWAFSSVVAVEANLKLNTGIDIVLSEQQLVDCDNNDNGCNGGWPTYAYGYMSKSGNVQASSYPYRSVKGTCTYKNDGLKIVTGSRQCDMGNCSIDKWLELLRAGPMTVVVDAGAREFQNYRGGIIDPKSCDSINHGVIAYGFQPDPNGDYVMIKNSWGPRWGNNGDIYIRYNTTTSSCQSLKTGWLPLVQNPGKVPPVPPAPTPVPPTPTPTPPTPADSPVFYTSCNYQGSSLKSNGSLSNLSTYRYANQILSTQKGQAYDVVLYTKENCLGNAVPIEKDEPCFSNFEKTKPLVNNSNSLSVVMPRAAPRDGCVNVYTAACYLNVFQELCSDVPDLNTYRLNDKIVAIHFGRGVRSVIPYKDAKYSGYSYQLTSSIANINQGNTQLLNNDISSIKILK